MPTQTQKPLEELFFADDRTELNRGYWNRFVREVAVRLRSLDRIRIDWEAVSQQGIDVALARINEVLLPASQRIRDVADLGFLIANSTTERTLVEGEIIQFIVEDEDQRDLFTPGPFLAVTRLETPDDYAVGRLMFFDRETGVLDIRIEAIFGNAGPHSDWQFSAVAGAVQAQVQILATVQGLLSDVETLRGETATDRGLAEDARTGAETAAGLAVSARSGAETARDAFVALYRGPEAQPLAAGGFVGQLVFDTTEGVMKQWTDAGEWRPSFVSLLAQLLDVDLTTTPPQAGDGLVFDGDEWLPGPAGGGMFKGNNGTVGSRSGDLFRVNAQSLTENTTIAADENASVTGPLTVASGVTLTVADGGTLRIL